MAPRQPKETRRKILDAAFWEIYRNGYQGASIDRILEGTAVTKGALFHHFPNKRQLGYVVVDELVRSWVREHWIQPVAADADPGSAVSACLREYLDRMPDEVIHGGCPLNNVTQEMAGVDEGFRGRLESIAGEWREAVAGMWRRGQADGYGVGLEATSAAVLIVSSIEGLLGAAKSAKSRTLAAQGADSLVELLGLVGRPGS